MKKFIKKLIAPFGKGNFWVIGLGGSVLWIFVFWLAYKIGAVEFNGETVEGSFLAAFGFSYIAQLIYNK